MSMTMEDSVKRWTEKLKSALVVEIMQGKTTRYGRAAVNVHLKKLEQMNMIRRTR